MQIKGEVLRTVRKEQNMSQEDLALELKVTVSTISNWERKEYVPDERYNKPIARALDVSVYKLTGVPSNVSSVDVKPIDTYEKENILLERLMESFEQFIQEKEKNIESDKQEFWEDDWRNG
ncbi:helix-turn-helix transcriptional regulator [Psychrobacillus sp. INOP01]|uniref:helix-turn-helix domain-containing protein n=1 Tax=Psychrobacillus sp. INOP01 TaxID=2829187 RepID=UPI001BA7E46C|nr:helix-turn-helix transcriptional regulator [Psychrobacillus sp. INOP01]QUG43036.1 helix-turn-helix transcriptional regulator [Psychrobacillus sp. INOP01]